MSLRSSPIPHGGSESGAPSTNSLTGPNGVRTEEVEPLHNLRLPLSLPDVNRSKQEAHNTTQSAEEMHRLVVLHSRMLGTTSDGRVSDKHATAMQENIASLHSQFPNQPISYSAQAYFHASQASVCESQSLQQSHWQSALQALGTLQQLAPGTELCNQTLVDVAAISFRQASTRREVRA